MFRLLLIYSPRCCRNITFFKGVVFEYLGECPAPLFFAIAWRWVYWMIVSFFIILNRFICLGFSDSGVGIDLARCYPSS